MKTIEILKLAIVGKKVEHRNRYGKTVILEVENIKVENGSRELEPSTRENDWWPAEERWTNWYMCFVDGSQIEFNPESEIKIIES